MDIFSIIVEQLLQMFIVVIFGFMLAKNDVLNETTQQEIARMLTQFVVPLTLVLAFQQPFERQQLVGIFWAFIGAVFIFLTRILWAHLGFRNAGKIDRYATVFSNSVFVGIPIIFPILGYEGILYLSMYLIVSGTLQYTYGIWSLSEGKEKITIRSALTNPGILGTVTGLVLYLFQIQLPEVVFNSLDTIASLSSPLGMILLGGYLARSHFKEVFFTWRNYWVISNRLIITPILGFIVLWLLPIDDPTILLTLAIVNCTPSAVNTAVFSQIYGGDYEYGARLVILSSIFSLITIPFLITAAMNLF
jgi:hypothetical protein